MTVPAAMDVVWSEAGDHRKLGLPLNITEPTEFPGAPFREFMTGGLNLSLYHIPGGELLYWETGCIVLDGGGEELSALGAQVGVRLGRSDFNDVPVQRVAGEAASIVHWPARQNYCHLLGENLPLIEGLHSARLLSRLQTLIVDPYRTSFTREALTVYGASPQFHVIDSAGRGRLKVDDLFIFDPLLHPAHWVHNVADRFFRRLSEAVAVQPSAPRDLVIQRQQGGRRFLNARDVMNALPGFTPVRLEMASSLFEQVRIFKAARTIVGAHGAGLTNLVFCDESTRVVEIFSRAYGTPTFWALATLPPVHYHATLDTRGALDYLESTKWDDILVNTTELATLVKSFG